MEAEALLTGGTIRGSSFGINSRNKRALYCAMGNTVFRSLADGDSATWASVGTPIPSCSKVNAFIVSPKDTNVMLAAVVRHHSAAHSSSPTTTARPG